VTRPAQGNERLPILVGSHKLHTENDNKNDNTIEPRNLAQRRVVQMKLVKQKPKVDGLTVDSLLSIEKSY